ncbi:MAG: hypothetical protein WBH56_15705, partial [Bacteroidota bacterium]
MLPIDATRRRNRCAIGLMLLMLLMLLSGLSSSGCKYASEAQCQNEPLGSVTVWVEDYDTSVPLRFSGIVKALLPEKAGFDGMTVADKDGGERLVRFLIPETGLPLELGQLYDFEVQYIGGWPAASSIFIRDDAGLLFVGVSDWDMGSNVVKDGVPGFEVEKITSDCRSRPHGSCYDELRNAVLKVTAGEEGVALFHGESARLGPYKVTCLTCQEVVYNGSCADAGLISISYT